MLESHFLNTVKTKKQKPVPKDQKGNAFAGDKTHSPETKMEFEYTKYIDCIKLGFSPNMEEICCFHVKGWLS